MKNRMKIRSTRDRYERKKDGKTRTAVVGMMAVILLLITLTYTLQTTHWFTDQQPALSLDDKCRRIGYPTNSITWMKERHVGVVEASPRFESDPLIEPIHIVTRQSETNSWKLTGTGGLLKNYPGYLITAYHVMETDTPLHFGYRQISTRELDGTEPVVPITGVITNGTGDDSVMCTYDSNLVSAPAFAVAVSESRFKDFLSDAKYVTEYYSARIRMSTYPDTMLRSVFMIHVRQNTALIFCRNDAAYGESGTLGRVLEETNQNARVIQIRRMPIPPVIFNILPKEWQGQLDWSVDRHYAVFEMINLQ